MMVGAWFHGGPISFYSALIAFALPVFAQPVSALPFSILIASVFVPAPLLAQSADEEDEEDEREIVLDLTRLQTRPSAEFDEQCEAQMDAARLVGEIVVCRSLGEATDGSWNAKAFERRYAQRTQGPKAPDVDGSGLILPTEGSIFMVTFTTRFGEVSDPPVMVDFETLPEAPEGSDADRIARGLPPLGED
ncbi:hypothetical protein EH31_06395 [Erythrobacter longus]|uniref:Uncharacterized protein n=1 Tax=Erythrobacter longus TaxID=1044 RepID=A0A074MQ52_ERYLO|nr:hypothetical protein [Erythrobacter longus]KEO87782.1 hypothetical protein EH31_06395 [Erythrobacter longus]